MSCEAATQTEQGSGTATGTIPRTTTERGAVSLRRGKGARRARPTSMVDHQSYRDTQLLVTRFLQHQSPSSLTPEVQELIDSIKSVLRSDQEHMEEAVRCANYIQQVRISLVSALVTHHDHHYRLLYPGINPELLATRGHSSNH